MDKTEYQIKLDEINRLIELQEFEDAMAITDTIEWKRVKSVRTLCMVAEIYEINGELEESMRILQLAYKRSSLGKTILYRQVELALKMKKYDDAVKYYNKYLEAASNDTSRYVLKYKIYKAQNAPLEDLIGILEEYKEREYTERWVYELARLYKQAGNQRKCVETCDDLILWFGEGRYVIKAMELKMTYVPLSPAQKEKYEQRNEIPDALMTRPVTKKSSVKRGVSKEEKAGSVAETVDANQAENVQKAIVLPAAKSVLSKFDNISAAAKANLSKYPTFLRQEKAVVNAVEEQTIEPIAEAAATLEREESTPVDVESEATKSTILDEVVVEESAVIVKEESSENVTETLEEESVETVEETAGEETAENAEETAGEETTENAEETAGEETAENVTEAAGELSVDADISMEEMLAAAVKDFLNEDAELAAMSGESERKEVTVSETAEKTEDSDTEESAEESENAESEEAVGEEVTQANSVIDTEQLQINLAKSLEQVFSGINRSKLEDSFENLGKSVGTEMAHDTLEEDLGDYTLTDLVPETASAIIIPIDDTVGEVIVNRSEEESGQEVVETVVEDDKEAETTEDKFDEIKIEEEVNENLSLDADFIVPEPVAIADVKELDLEALFAETSNDFAKIAESIMGESWDVENENKVEEVSVSGEEECEETPETVEKETEETTETAEEETEETPETMEEETEETTETAEEETEETIETAGEETEETIETAEEETEETTETAEEEAEETPETAEEKTEESLDAVSEDDISEVVDDVELKNVDLDNMDEDVSSEKTIDDDMDTVPPVENVFDVDFETMLIAEAESVLEIKVPEQKEENVEESVEEEVQEVEEKTEEDLVERLMKEAESEPTTYESLADETPEDKRRRILKADFPTVLSDEQKALFSYFCKVPGMNEQILAAINGVYKYADERTSRRGNIAIMGSNGTGKTRLGEGLVKAICKRFEIEAAKYACIDALELNRKDVAAVVSKMSGGFLMVERAHLMTDLTINNLSKAMEFRTDSMVLIIEDEKRQMRNLLASYPEFAEKIETVISIPVFTNDELVTFARTYAKENGFKMDELGVLALYALIGENQRDDEPITVGRVKTMVDQAIRHANNARLGRRISKRHVDEDGRILLYEKDFAD